MITFESAPPDPELDGEGHVIWFTSVKYDGRFTDGYKPLHKFRCWESVEYQRHEEAAREKWRLHYESLGLTV